MGNAFRYLPPPLCGESLGRLIGASLGKVLYLMSVPGKVSAQRKMLSLFRDETREECISTLQVPPRRFARGASQCNGKIKSVKLSTTRVCSKFFKQGPVDPDQRFNRDHDRN